jgi:hypothetical protein
VFALVVLIIIGRVRKHLLPVTEGAAAIFAGFGQLVDAYKRHGLYTVRGVCCRGCHIRDKVVYLLAELGAVSLQCVIRPLLELRQGRADYHNADLNRHSR